MAFAVQPRAVSPPVPAPTDTPTGVPLANERIIAGVIVDDSNNPVKGARVVVLGVGVATTNERGEFTIEAPAAGATYTVIVKKEGITLPSAVISLRSGELALIEAQVVPVKGPACRRREITGLIVKVGSVASQLRSRALADASRLREATMIRGDGTTLSVQNRVNEQFDRLLIALLKLPDKKLRCPSSEVSCTQQSLRGIKRVVRGALNDLQREAQLVNREMRERNKRAEKTATRVKQIIKRKHRLGRRYLSDIPNTSDTCT